MTQFCLLWAIQDLFQLPPIVTNFANLFAAAVVNYMKDSIGEMENEEDKFGCAGIDHGAIAGVLAGVGSVVFYPEGYYDCDAVADTILLALSQPSSVSQKTKNEVLAFDDYTYAVNLAMSDLVRSGKVKEVIKTPVGANEDTGKVKSHKLGNDGYSNTVIFNYNSLGQIESASYARSGEDGTATIQVAFSYQAI